MSQENIPPEHEGFNDLCVQCRQQTPQEDAVVPHVGGEVDTAQGLSHRLHLWGVRPRSPSPGETGTRTCMLTRMRTVSQPCTLLPLRLGATVGAETERAGRHSRETESRARTLSPSAAAPHTHPSTQLVRHKRLDLPGTRRCVEGVTQHLRAPTACAKCRSVCARWAGVGGDELGVLTEV